MAAPAKYHYRIEPACLQTQDGQPFLVEQTIGYGAECTHPTILIQVAPIASLLLFAERHTQVMRPLLLLFTLPINLPIDTKALPQDLHTPFRKLMRPTAIPIPA